MYTHENKVENIEVVLQGFLTITICQYVYVAIRANPLAMVSNGQQRSLADISG